MLEKVFWSVFAKRGAICFFIILSLFFTCVLRVAVIANSGYAEVQKSQSSLKIKIQNNRGTIFDHNKYPITNNNKKIIACVSPTPRAITAISTVLKGETLNSVLESLKSGKPVTCEVPNKIDCEGIICTEIYETSKTIPAIHTIGYRDNENNGISGLEKAYNDILTFDQPVIVRYACDSKGRILSGIQPEIVNQVSPYSNGVVTTIDINIQNITDKAAENLKLGAIVVAEVNSSKIRAITSVPTFTTNTLSSLLSSEDSPLYNRALGAYNVGSAFKPCVAAAGIEIGKNNFCYTCTGSFEIIDRVFKCHEKTGHGYTDLNHAIAYSCNTYFYNFSFLLGNNQLLNFATNLNFGRSIKLCEGLVTAKGTLPTKEKLENIAHLANFSIGQGDFTASPVSLLPLYCAIANGGKYYLPSVVESTIQNGKETKYDIGSPTKVMSNSTAEKLKTALSLVISEGTGVLANPKTVTAAGKTATAQTGKYKNGNEIKSSWFCGFFPLEAPEYVIIVFCEDQSKQTKTCAEIFAGIADEINALS